MCGAYDCYACRGESALRYREEERWGSEEECGERDRCLCGEEMEEGYGSVPAKCPECGEEPDPERICLEDAEVWTTTRITTHVARKVHKGYHEGRSHEIQPGDTYRRVVYMGYIRACRDYPEGGPRFLRVIKNFVPAP
jgi:hypothetical protein